MEITKSQIKRLIKEEVARMTSEEQKTKGFEMANSLFEDLQRLDQADQQIFLELFVKMVNEKIS
jgi:hypothetical protein